MKKKKRAREKFRPCLHTANQSLQDVSVNCQFWKVKPRYDEQATDTLPSFHEVTFYNVEK